MVGHTGLMSQHSARAELSSIATSLDELSSRVGTTAESLDREPTEAAAASLFEVERALRTAARSLARALRDLA